MTPTYDWLSAFVPLGTLSSGTWTPSGSGVLFLDEELVWLLTTRQALQVEEGAHVAAWAGQEGTTILDLTAAQEGNGLAWVEHPELDLAACLFPLDPSWDLKAFSESSCLRPRDVTPLLPCCVLGCPYGLEAEGRPPTLALDGMISGVDPNSGLLYTTAPLLPANSGAPLLALTAPPTLGGTVLLAGIMTHSVPLRANERLVPSGLVPPALNLGVALPIHMALGLIRSEAAVAQRKRVVAT